ncbi:MAG TPA: J domain-containing protein [Acidimicrobiales bacterium]
MAPTHYEVLGVPPSATPEQVRAAYRAKARDHHPDAGGDPDRMRAINAAWRVLGDPARRAAYDRALAGAGSGTGAAGGGADGRGGGAGGAGAFAPDDIGPDGGRRLTAEELADLADGRPFGATRALSGWWAILPPATLVAAVLSLFVAGYFTSPALLALSGGLFILALGLFVLAPLRAMAKRRD